MRNSESSVFVVFRWHPPSLTAIFLVLTTLPVLLWQPPCLLCWLQILFSR